MSKNVQPARLPFIDDTYDGYKGLAAGFFINGTTGIHLKEFSAVVIDEACWDEEVLCAKGNANWPKENTHSRGIDFLEVADYYGDDYEFYCVVGVRKFATEQSKLVQYYRTSEMRNWMAQHLGLIVPFPIVNKSGGLPVCTNLVDKFDNNPTMK